jgi:hypothetical protein
LDDLFGGIKIIGCCSFGFLAGVYLFFKGLRTYRRYRLLTDIPETTVRGISMGLAELHGKVTGDEMVTSPVSEQPCYFYKLTIKKGHKNLRGEMVWLPYATETDGPKFYLEDDTGKVLVDARGAEIDLPQSGQEYLGYGSRIFQGEDGKQVEVNAAGEIVNKVGMGARVGRLLGKKEPAPQAPLDPWVQEMCETMRAKNERLFECVARAAAHAQAGQSSPSDFKGGKFLLQEYCILPDYEYEVTGTCAENPQPQGGKDLKMIMKGTNDPTFLISFGNEAIVEGDLLHNAKMYVFGGAALSVASLSAMVWMFS